VLIVKIKILCHVIKLTIHFKNNIPFVINFLLFHCRGVSNGQLNLDNYLILSGLYIFEIKIIIIK
jgi:hypothetical protein